MELLTKSDLPLKLVGRAKVRDIYEVDDDHLLLVATDRISAFDVVMNQAVRYKGAVLTKLSAWWFRLLENSIQHHMVSICTDEIIDAAPILSAHRSTITARAMLCRRVQIIPIEGVVRGYLSGSAWKEYSELGTLAGEPLPAGLKESQRLTPPIFSPATKPETGHDQNIPISKMAELVGGELAQEIEELSLAVYERGRSLAADRGLILADTKFEFGRDSEGRVILADEVLTPHSSRFWPAEQWVPGAAPPSFDKQPLRDYLQQERAAGRWNGEAPPPTLADEVLNATSARYLELFRRMTGTDLDVTQ
ncbi:MAG: phosphoribosylaminoimidazolesuccinocarboxamide synthase [Candidatus Binataceae bacterium]